MVESREHLVATDPSFAELYGSVESRMATVSELLASMDAAGVDVSVAAGFWWRSPELAEEHADYLLEIAAVSGGRIIPFVPVDLSMDDVVARLQVLAGEGARGLGEVRPENQDLGLDETNALLGRASEEFGLTVLLHGSEQVGHSYAGKVGGYTASDLWDLFNTQSANVIAAHWGGGFPFYALMPEVRSLLESGRIVFDTAASGLLYEPRVFKHAIEILGRDSVLWGSDFPLRDQSEDRIAVETALPSTEDQAAVLGENASRFLELTAVG